MAMKKKNAKRAKMLSELEEREVHALATRLLHPPVLYWDVYLPATSITTTPTYLGVCDPAQNASQGGRVADTIKLSRLELRLSINQVNTDLFSSVRVIFFLWKVDNAVDQPTGTDILHFLTTPEVAPYQWETRHKYTILYDRVFPLTGSATSLTTMSNVFVSKTINMRSAQVQFNQGAISGTGLPYVMYVSNSVAPPFPVMDMTTRCYYNLQLSL